MSNKAIVALVAGLALAAVASAQQAPSRLAPGESRSIFDQGAAGRLRQIFGSNSRSHEASQSPASSTPRVAHRPSTSARRTTPRTASRSYGRSNLFNRPRTASRRTAPAAAPATNGVAAAAGTATNSPEDANAGPGTIVVPRQEALLASDAPAQSNDAPAPQLTAATGNLPIVRAAPRPVMPTELAKLPSPNDPLFDIPRNNNPSPLLAAEAQQEDAPIEVGLSPAPEPTLPAPAAEEPAPAPPAESQPAAPEAEPIYAAQTPLIQAAPIVQTTPRPVGGAVDEETITIEPLPAEMRAAISAQPSLDAQPLIVPAVPRTAAPPAIPVQAQPVAPPKAIAAQPIEPQPIAVQPSAEPVPSIADAAALPRVSASVPAPAAEFVAPPVDRSDAPRPAVAAPIAPAAAPRLTATIAGPKEIYTGNTGIFQVQLVNEGDAPASQVRVELRADDSLLKTLNVGDIAAQTDVQVEISLSPHKNGPLDLRAIATSAEGAKAAAGSIVFVGKPVLSLAIAGPPQFNHGDAKSYTVILNNTGNCDATNVNVLVMVQGEEAQTLKVGLVPAGQTRQARFELRPEQSGQLAVNAVATADGQVRAVANGAIQVVKHQLQLAFEGPREMRFGEKVVYTLVVANRGEVEAKNLVVNVTLGESTLDRLYEGTLAAGKEQRIEFEVCPSQPGFHALKAEATEASGLQLAASADLQVQHGQLELAINCPTGKFAGSEGAYQVRVKNIGDASVADVLVTAQLPESVEYLSGVERINFYDGVTWRVGALAPGQEKSFELRCELTASGAQKAVFQARGAGEIEAMQSASMVVAAPADVRLFVADPQGLVPVGDEVVYEIEVHNCGVKTAENVSVVMQLAAALEPLQVAGGEARLEARGIVFDPIASLAAQETVKLRVTARAKEKGNHPFRVEMTADQPSTFMASEGTTRCDSNLPVDQAASATGEE